jgi:hypothetical protein
VQKHTGSIGGAQTKEKRSFLRNRYTRWCYGRSHWELRIFWVWNGLTNWLQGFNLGLSAPSTLGFVSLFRGMCCCYFVEMLFNWLALLMHLILASEWLCFDDTNDLISIWSIHFYRNWLVECFFVDHFTYSFLWDFIKIYSK